MGITPSLCSTLDSATPPGSTSDIAPSPYSAEDVGLPPCSAKDVASSPCSAEDIITPPATWMTSLLFLALWRVSSPLWPCVGCHSHLWLHRGIRSLLWLCGRHRFPLGLHLGLCSTLELCSCCCAVLMLSLGCCTTLLAMQSRPLCLTASERTLFLLLTMLRVSLLGNPIGLQACVGWRTPRQPVFCQELYYPSNHMNITWTCYLPHRSPSLVCLTSLCLPYLSSGYNVFGCLTFVVCHPF